MSHIAHRKWFGLVLVTLSGFLYALVSQVSNRVAMPGIPLYQPPFGAFGNIILAIFIAVSLGVVISWAETGGVGVLWGSLLGALFIAIATMLTGQNEGMGIWSKLFGVIMLFVPTAGILVPVLVLFRWAIGREEENYRNASKGYPSSRFGRSALPAGLMLAAGALGLFSLYNDVARAITPQMDVLIRQGRQAQSADTLPAPLRPPDVNRFLEKSSRSYTLQWDKDDQNRFAIPRPAGSADNASIVIARFENSYLLVCMFPSKTTLPTCRDFASE